MLSKHRIVRLFLCLVVLGWVAALPVFAGSAAVGSVAGTISATVGGQTLVPNTTLFGSDSLQVKGGGAGVAPVSASRIVFGHAP
jgi:energy-converting hydrogenase Eha subunit H